MKFLPFLLISLLFTSAALAAEDKAIQKYRNYTPQEILSLKDSSNVPAVYISAAERGISPGAELLFGMELNQLMYAGIHDFKKAVMAFQNDLGDLASGTLTVWQIHNLEQRADLQKLSRVVFPDQFSHFKTEDYASIQGTMIVIDGNMILPINHIKLKCYKKENYCQIDQIKLSVHDDADAGKTYYRLENSTEYYEVATWKQDIITATPNEVGHLCKATSLNLNFDTKKFYYITHDVEKGCEETGVSLDQLPATSTAQIVSGTDIIQSEFIKVEKAAFDALASDFKRRVQKVSFKSRSKEITKEPPTPAKSVPAGP
ncbi:MAG: hypothetical protein OEV35_01510 [Gallionellaceae bacterium]|nr:hypothetical protein [Gallionellaceae bacterium]